MSVEAFNRLHPNYGSNLVAGVDVNGWRTIGQLSDSLSWARFCYVKATEGVTFYDGGETGAFVDVCKQRGIPWGLYHFAHPEQGNGPQAEAAYFVAATRSLGMGPLPPVLDLERGDGDMSSWSLAFLAELTRLTGRTDLMVYSYAGWIDSHLTNPLLARFPLWLAHYTAANVNAWCPVGPWSQWAIWQWQDTTAEFGALDVNVAHHDWFDNVGDDGFTDADRQALTRLVQGL